jgi:nucleoid-associated protein YgaU
MLRRDLINTPTDRLDDARYFNQAALAKGEWRPATQTGPRYIQPGLLARSPRRDAAATTERDPERGPMAAAAETTTYRVQPRDSYWRIARKLLGRGELWPRIRELNPQVSEKQLRTGMEILVPRRLSERID